MKAEEDARVTEAVEQERTRLRNFIQRRVSDAGDAEDILQDVFYELVLACRFARQIENVGAWRFRVARNRITDRFRRMKPEVSIDAPVAMEEDGEQFLLQDLLPSAEAGPEAAYARSVLVEQLEDALDELPREQREVFIAHEFEGRSFGEIASATGINLNTLLARKRYAVLHLRERLRSIYEEFLNE